MTYIEAINAGWPDLGTMWSPNSLYKELHERNLVQSMLRIENQPKENGK